MTEVVKVLNVSGKPLDVEEWTKGSKALAIQTARFIAEYNKEAVAISTTDDGCLIINYVLHGRIQPAVKIDGTNIDWPVGTDFNLMMKFLEG